jgi:hypothetical protein
MDPLRRFGKVLALRRHPLHAGPDEEVAMPSAEQVVPELAPLLEVIGAAGCLRLVAWPGRVWVDRAEGSARVEVGWSAEQHTAALGALVAPVLLDRGVTAAEVAGSIVLRRPPDALRRMENLSHDGRLSPLAARFLSAALRLGRNVLVTSPWAAGVELIAALLAEGQRPAVAGTVGDAVPPSWPMVDSERMDELWALGSDRIGSWSLGPADLVELLGRGTGVAAWIDAGRLDRALLRFEAGVEQAFRGATAPLRVLGGIDLVVVVGDAGGVRVRQIAEICLADEGYRPRLLFTTDVPPVPTALVPVAAPGFLDELAHSGHQLLADELRHAVPPERAQAVVPPPEAPEVAPVQTVAEPQPGPRAPPDPLVEMPTPDPALVDAPPPGWELDQLGDEVAGDTMRSSPEAAALAASFGLGPPPPPPGVAPIGPEVVSGEAPVVAPPSFEEAMARARERDAELQRSSADEDPEAK